MPQPGDIVIYTGNENSLMTGREGIVSSKFQSGREFFGYKNVSAFDTIPVIFRNQDGHTFIYEAWYENLTIVKLANQKPIWEI